MVDPFLKIATFFAGFLKIVSLTPQNFPPCNTQPIRGKRALIGGKIILVHCTQDGKFNVQPIDQAEKKD